MTARVVLINGVGSVGKSSVAKALQRIASRPMMHVSMDDFLGMLPPGTFGDPDYYTFETHYEDGFPVTAVRSGPVMLRLLSGMRAAVAAMAQDGLDLVVDDVFWGDELADYRRRLGACDLRTVGLMAPLDVLEARERARGDRVLGLARWQFGRVHRGCDYDLTLDTSRLSADEAAVRVKQAFEL